MATTQPVQSGRRYRRLVFGVLIVGIISLLVGTLADRSLVGLVVYAAAVVVGFATMFYAQYHESVSLQDEREAELERRASHVVFQLFGYLGLFAFIALLLLDATGSRPLMPTEETLLYVYSIVSLTWGGVYLVLRYRG